MSTSSLWGMDKEFRGEEIEEFRNSWLFAPIVMNILFAKYLPNKVNGQYGKTNFITAIMFDNTIFNDLNREINNCKVLEDRIVWELANQQVLFSKDKQLIHDSILKFIELNKHYEDNLGEHIIERFKEVAKSIIEIDSEKYLYLIHKNSSCDDGVEYWFEKYDEESEEYISSSLKELDKNVTEFVVIEGENISFISNLKFFKQESEE